MTDELMQEAPATPSAAWVYRTLIVPAAIAPQARAVGEALGPSSSGMWLTGLSSTGLPPATHFISAGLISSDMAALLETPEALSAGATALGVDLSLEVATALLSSSTVDARPHSEVLDELGLQMVREPEGEL